MQGDEKEAGGCGCARGRRSQGLMPLSDLAAGIFGGKGGGNVKSTAAVVEVLVSISSSLYEVTLILTSVYTHHLLLLPLTIHHLLATLNHICPGCVFTGNQ